jgi:hypothetical protein
MDGDPGGHRGSGAWERADQRTHRFLVMSETRTWGP